MGGLRCDKEMKDTRRKRRRQKKPNNFTTEEREREREQTVLSQHSHTSSLFNSLFLLSYHQRRESKKRGKLSVTFYISLFYKKPLNTRITTETQRKKDEEIVHTLALFFATDDILVAPLFTSTREFESIIIIFVYVAIKVRQKTEISEGDFLEV